MSPHRVASKFLALSNVPPCLTAGILKKNQAKFQHCSKNATEGAPSRAVLPSWRRSVTTSRDLRVLWCPTCALSLPGAAFPMPPPFSFSICARPRSSECTKSSVQFAALFPPFWLDSPPRFLGSFRGFICLSRYLFNISSCWPEVVKVAPWSPWSSGGLVMFGKPSRGPMVPHYSIGAFKSYSIAALFGQLKLAHGLI
jgi:hypothetical protein